MLGVSFVALTGLASIGLFAWQRVRTVEPEQALEYVQRGGNGPPTVVLLHGYGSTPENWSYLLTALSPTGNERWLFPRGPESTAPPDGPATGFAWWRLRLEDMPERSNGSRDLSASSPLGIERAARQVTRLLHEESRTERPVLGGFSQGAMVAMEVALSSEQPLSGVVVLSGSIVDAPKWQSHYARLEGVPVFISHGRMDRVLPFDLAEQLHDELGRAGAKVTWAPFDGDHSVPAEVIEHLRRFLESVSLEQQQ